MGVYVVSAIILLFIILNYFFSVKLYQEPENEQFYNNVKSLNFIKEKYIVPQPKYVTLISILLGLLFGAYISLAKYYSINKWLVLVIILLLIMCYLVEITRKIIIKDGKLILSKAFSKKIEFSGNEIKGMYIYSYNKKFLNKHALTTKLIVVTKTDKKYKFVLSSLNNKSVLNMMKENFGITNYKMYIAKKKTR